MIPFCCTNTGAHTRPLTHTQSRPYSTPQSWQNLSILEKGSIPINQNKRKPRKSALPITKRTENKTKAKPNILSSTIALPPQPGNKTLSPALTDVGTRPLYPVHPGPTAITVNFRERTRRGRSREEYSVAVFCESSLFVRSSEQRKKARETHGFGLKAGMDQDAVQEGH